MSTFGDLVTDVQQYMYGFGADRDKLTSLAAAIDGDDLTLIVADGSQIDRGFIEIDDELLEVAAVDRNSGTLQIHPFGRGSRGSLPAAHMVGSKVTSNPRFPRARVRAEVANAVNALYPDLFSVDVDESITAQAARVTYALPADAEGVVSVSGQTLGPSGMWRPANRWRFDALADTTAYPSGRSIDVYEPVAPGRKLKVLYKKRPSVPASDATTLTQCGIQDSWRDLIRLKAVSQLLLGLEAIRLNTESVESLARDSAQQPFLPTQIARQMLLMYQNRLAEEIRTQYRLYPTTAVRMG